MCGDGQNSMSFDKYIQQGANIRQAKLNASAGASTGREMSREINAIMKTLNDLPLDVKKNRKAILRKAAKPLVASAQSKAPVLRSKRKVNVTLKNGSQLTYYPNNLRLSLKVLNFRKSGDVFVGPKVSKRRKAGEEYGKSKGKVDAFYAAMLEYGTRNMSARPYMRPAYEATKGQVIDIIAKEVTKLVSEFGRKHAK